MSDKYSLKIPAGVIIVVCIAILCGIAHLKTIETGDFVKTVIFPVIEMLCSISITAALGTYLIEWKGFVEYVKGHLSEIVASPSMVRNLSEGYQVNLFSCLIEERAGIREGCIKELMEYFISVIKTQRDTYGYYLLEQSNTVVCKAYRESEFSKLPSNERYKELRHTRSSTYGKLREGTVTIQELLIVNTQEEKTTDGKATVIVESVRIDSRLLAPDEYEVVVDRNKALKKIQTPYEKTYICRLKKPHEVGNSTKVIVRYQTIESCDDYSYCTRMKNLCKRFTINFTYDEDFFSIHGQSLTFGERKNQYLEGNSLRFDIDNWLLPGEGTNIYIGVK